MAHQLIINVQIEILPFTPGVKYEIEKETGRIFVDRFLETPMHYPCHYGKIEGTLAGDGDELDALVIVPFPLLVGVYVPCRPIGTLNMTDEKGEDAKVIMLPADKLTTCYQSIQSITDIESSLLNRIRYFFEHYKDLDKDKWVKVQPGWGDKQAAEKLIEASVAAYHEE